MLVRHGGDSDDSIIGMRFYCVISCLALSACVYGHPLVGVVPQNSSVGGGELSGALALLGLLSASGTMAADGAGATDSSLTVHVSADTVLTYESITFSAVDGTPPYNFQVTRGGGTITSSGVYSAAAVPGDTSVTVTDSTGRTGIGSVTVSGGSGDGTFQTSLNYTAFDAPHSIQSGDFTGDGVLDLLVGTSNAGAQEMRIFEGNGDGSFQVGTSNSVGDGVRSVTVGDFNSDGNLDMAGGTTGNKFVVFLGNGDVTFQSRVDYAHALSPLGVRAGDMDNDGVLDMVSGDMSGNSISFWKGTGDGTFQAASTFGSVNSPRNIEIADFNYDGALDIVAANVAGTPSTNPGATVFLGNGDGTFQDGVENSAAADVRNITLGDFNGDGYLDIVCIPNSGSDITVFLGNGDGSFQTALVYTVSGANVDREGMACDFNGDGRMDLAVGDRGNNVVAILFGDGAGSFIAGPQLSAASDPHGVHCRDLNGDGKMDVAVASFGTDLLRVFLGN